MSVWIKSNFFTLHQSRPFPAKMVQNGARMVNGTYTAPPLHIVPTALLFMTYALVLHGWSWQRGKCVASKANWPHLGRSNHCHTI